MRKKDRLFVLTRPLSGPWFWADWTWGLSATVCGFLFTILNSMLGVRFVYLTDQGAVFLADCRLMPAYTGLSLGPYLFGGRGFSDWKHEFGHTLQNRIIGPFYFPVIGLPSVLSAMRKRPEKHRQLFCEKWADHLSSRFEST